MVTPLEICESAHVFLTEGVQAKAEQKRLQGTPHLMLTLATGSAGCLH